MEDAERATPSKSRTSNAIRVERHRLRTQARVQLLGLLLKDPTVRTLANALANADAELANALANDPWMLANALANAPSLELAGVLANGRVVPPVASPPTPPSPPSKRTPPPTGEEIPSPASPVRQRDALIDAWADVFGKGDYRNLSDREFGQALKANQKLRKMAERTGRTTDEMADGIRVAANNWPNVMTANRSMSIAMIVDNWGALVHGPHTKGRSNGTVHTQYLNESAAVKHTPKLQSQESYRRD